MDHDCCVSIPSNRGKLPDRLRASIQVGFGRLVSIPSNRGKLPDYMTPPGSSAQLLCLNPLKSGQTSGQYRTSAIFQYCSRSQSPQIGANFRTDNDGVEFEFYGWSQSPQIGANFRTNHLLVRGDGKSYRLNPLKSGQTSGHIVVGVVAGATVVVSIPSNRGKLPDRETGVR